MLGLSYYSASMIQNHVLDSGIALVLSNLPANESVTLETLENKICTFMNIFYHEFHLVYPFLGQKLIHDRLALLQHFNEFAIVGGVIEIKEEVAAR